MPATLKVMSFNIRGSYCADGENAWEKRAGLNVRTIRSVAPDLIGFQELQLGNLETYGRELKEYDFHLGPKYGTKAPFCWPAVFWDSGKLLKVAAEEFWLSRTPDRHSGDWDTAYYRSALMLRMRRLADGAEFVVVNTHLDNVSELARVEGARLILDRLASFAPSLPVILMADFNCDAGSAVYRACAAAGFRDTFVEAGGDDDPDASYTFHSFKGQRNPRWARIDWILMRDGGAGRWATRSFRIVRDAEPPVYPSDHWPVVAGVELQGALR